MNDKYLIFYPIRNEQVFFIKDKDKTTYTSLKIHLQNLESEESGLDRLCKELNVDLRCVKNMGKLGFKRLAKSSSLREPEYDVDLRINVIVGNFFQEPQFKDNMEGEWFDLDKVPYDKLNGNAYLWLPKLLSGEKINMDFVYSNDGILMSFAENKELNLNFPNNKKSQGSTLRIKL